MAKEKESLIAQAAAEETAEDANVFSYEFRKPVDYDGVTYTALDFDFSNLTGADALNIEEELQAIGKTPIAAAFSSEYLIRMAAKACAQPIGADFFRKCALADFEAIKNRARRFLLASE